MTKSVKRCIVCVKKQQQQQLKIAYLRIETISVTAPCFRNFCVYKPRALRKKPSDLWCSCIVDARLEKHSECRLHFFLSWRIP